MLATVPMDEVLNSLMNRLGQVRELEDEAESLKAMSQVSDHRMDELKFLTWLVRSGGYQDVKPLVGMPGYWAGLTRLAFHWSIQGGRIGDEISVPIRYCYTDDYAAAKAALDAWDGTGEPGGWQRAPHSHRRRVGGDPAMEYVDP
jgi:hypothetical protein